MKLPTLSRIWKVLRNAVAALCGLVIVIALLPSKARSHLGPAQKLRCYAAGFHPAKSTAISKLRAAGGISPDRDYSSQKHGRPIRGPIRPDASALPVAHIECDPAHTATAR